MLKLVRTRKNIPIQLISLISRHSPSLISWPVVTSPGFSFSAAGLLFPYHLGVSQFLIEKGYIKEKAIEISKPIIEALKAKGISSVGASGNCWGAKPVIQLAKSGLVKVGAISHPAFVTADDFKGIDVPIAILGAEIDHLSPPEVIKQFEQALATNSGVDSFVKIYPKVEHGWTTRYKDDDPVAVKAAEEAHEDLLAWFSKHLK